MNNIEEIKKFIINELVTDQDFLELKNSDPLIEIGIIDSLGIKKMMVFLEERFGFEISDEDILPENFESIEAIHSFAKRKMD